MVRHVVKNLLKVLICKGIGLQRFEFVNILIRKDIGLQRFGFIKV